MDNLSSTSNTTSESEENIQVNIKKTLIEERNFKLAEAMVQILQEIILEDCSKRNLLPDPFSSKTMPSMPLIHYLKRVIKYSKPETSSLILAMIYIDKVCENSKYVLNINNIHKFLLTSLLVAIKFNEDDFYKNSQYAKIGGLENKEMNQLELEFYFMIDFALFVNSNLYEKYEKYFGHLIAKL